MGANLNLGDAELANTDGIALNLDRASLAELEAAGLVVSAGSVVSSLPRSAAESIWQAHG